MSVLVYAESPKGAFKKAAKEAIYYGSLVAKELGVECHAAVLGACSDFSSISKYGASKIHHIDNNLLSDFDSQSHTAVLSELAKSVGAKIIILNHSANGKSLIGRLAIRMNAGSVTGVNSIPQIAGDSFKVKKGVFSGKAIAEYQISSENKVLSLMGNSFQPEEGNTTAELITVSDVDVTAPSVKIKEVTTMEGTVPLPEAELVVSAGRGMKGPENWGIIDDLANVIGATTACSRPVADTGWRPHHEHVGQTGVAIRPNLYIAIGISGAIQHLAGVNSSKTIVVINKDPEAPFFKAADYGICADLFDVVPKLTEAFKKFKANS